MNEQRDKKIKLRYNIVSTLIYGVGIILLVQLFNLQIVKGAEYREKSNTRLTRETTLEAARGNILDQSGNKLATTSLGYSLELYKTKVDNEILNNTLLKITEILEKNGDSYIDTFPIKVDPFEFTIGEEAQKEFKKKYNIEENKTAEECFYIFKDKYKIINEDLSQTRKIITLRYAISKNGYSNIRPAELASNIGTVSLAQISEQSAELPGVSINTKARRTYTSGGLASHILGYVGKIDENELKGKEDRYGLNDIIGKTGIEYIMEEYLKGQNGIKQVDMSVEGAVTDEDTAKEAVAGCDVVLTIDANLQRVTEDTLRSSIEEIENENGVSVSGASAVVMKAATGEVLAMASYPDFNPGDFTGGISAERWNYYTNTEESEYARMHPFVNRAISSPSSPGSTYKMATAIAGLETGAIGINEKINDTGRYTRYRDYQPYCWNRSGHGYLNVTNAIVKSCNYFFYEVGNRVGIEDLGKYTRALGLGKKTGIELLGEESGYVAGPETSKALGTEWYGGNTLAAAIGQENNTFTTLQMAKYTSIIANGGNDVDVTIIKSVINSEGSEIPKKEVEEYVNKRLNITNDNEEKVSFDPDNIEAVRAGMRGVTTETGGTAYSTFRNFSIEVGGKTGSAQTERFDENGKKITNAWFVGFAPYDDPEIAIVVMIENGQAGGKAAIPARDIIAEYFGMNADVVTEDMAAIPTIEMQR
ncbi:MAG: hypothetical protein J6M60_02660 [Clostridia bacterium]|nr:hypothetical protein [Clostridia bacterium]